MKLIPLILITAASIAVSCKSDPAAPTSAFSNASQATVAENDKSGGIYKGVIVGSSGYFTVVLQNGTKEIRLTLDGEKRTLTTAELSAWTSGTIIREAAFTAGDWTVKFSVGANGSGPSAILELTGHPTAEAAILKELSTIAVKVYEGTYAGSESGTWNFVLQDPVLSGVKLSSAGVSAVVSGLVNGTAITLQPPISGTGTISIDNVTGTWQTDTSASGTWTGKRVL